MKHSLLIWTLCLFLFGCQETDEEEQGFSLSGAWTLARIEHPVGTAYTFPRDGRTFLRLYDGDSVMFGCQLTQTATAVIIQPDEQAGITLLDKGGGEHLYLEDGEPRPLTVQDDTTIVIQRDGVFFTWHRANQISQEWGQEIQSIIVADMHGEDAGTHHYVLSSKERKQENYIHWLVGIVAGMLIVSVLMAWMYVANRRLMHRLQQQFRQLQQNYEQRPHLLKQVAESLENNFFTSDDYLGLQRRIATGKHLKGDEWNGVEALIRQVYPTFLNQLRALYPMSELEHQVCLLVKLRIAPSDIAAVLLRDVSTISSVRSRLYKKVFGQKGGAKEWDEFLHSIGT